MVKDFAIERFFKKHNSSHKNKYIEILDLKFINNGDGTAYITSVDVEILSCNINRSPNLVLECDIEDGKIKIYCKNLGWGSAKIKKSILSNSELKKITNQQSFELIIESGDKKKILELELKIDKLEFDEILLKRSKIFSQISELLESKDSNVFNYKEIDLYLSENERWHIEEYFENLKVVPIFEERQKWHIQYFKHKQVQHVPVNEHPRITVEFLDENDNEYKKNFTIEKCDLWFNEKELINNPKQLYYSLRKPEDIYLVILCPEKNRNKKYNLSHYIKGGDVERLHFLFASEKTADYVVRFVFYFNKGEKIQSDLFKLSLYTENRKDFFYDKIHDGSHFAFNDGEWRLE